MGSCLICGAQGPLISKAIKVCGPCLRADSPRSREVAARAHARSRREIGLPEAPPRDGATSPCQLCANRCQPSDGQRGLCGARRAVGRRVEAIFGTPQAASVSWRHDPLPANCCAHWVCPGSSAAGYPRYSHSKRAERGYLNLSVGYYGCTFDCLYCQSWRARDVELAGRHSARTLAAQVTEQTRCICFFGGDPTPQLAHALATARLARAQAARRGHALRICFETNGALHPRLLRQAADAALESGGCIKFDLKAFHPGVHQALCGASNERTLENFAWLAARRRERPEVPLALAATTLVPGYVDVEEVAPLARVVASLGADIPYLLIAFFSCHHLADLPATSRQQARRCLKAARDAGLTRLRLDGALRDAPEERRRATT